VYFHAIGVTATPRIKPLPEGERLTPGITRPPGALREHDKIRVAGRVHAIVRQRL
jgi:hypothetical protein